MRVLATCILAVGLVVSPAIAGTGPAGDKDGPAANTSTSAATQPASSPAAAASSAAPASKSEASSSEISAELQQLRDLLESQAKQLQEQQQKMLLLEAELNAATAARESSTAAPPVGDPNAFGSTSSAVAGSASLANTGASQDRDLPTSLTYKGITLTPGGFFAAEGVWRSKALASDVNTPFNSAPFDGSSNAHMDEFQFSGRQSRISMLAEGKLSNVKIGGYYEGDFLSAGTTSNNNQTNSYTFRQRQFFAQAAFTNGWTFTGGQQWSLITETAHGMDNRTEVLPLTIDAQYQVGFSWARQFGARLTKNFGDKIWLGFAVEESQATLTEHSQPTATCAPANPQVTGSIATCTASALTGTLVDVPTGTPAIPTTGTAVVNATSFNDFLLGAFGTSGGLYNPVANYQYNPAPDLVFKAVFEPGFGHYEVFGLLAEFRDRVFPCVNDAALAGCADLTTSGANAFNNTKTGGGGGGNARWSLFAKKVDVGIHFFGGDGIGRYGSGGLSDVTTKFVPVATGVPASLEDGTLAPIRNFQAMGTLVLHPTSKLDVYMYTGGEYDARTAYPSTFGSTVLKEGYGGFGQSNFGCLSEGELPSFAAQSTSASTGVPTGVAGTNGFIPSVPQNCTGDTRNLVEGTLGFWYRFYTGPKGRFQFGAQYSNYVRNTWRAIGTGSASGQTFVTNGAPHSDENMIFTSFRYYIP
jgi:hypothetical protein